MTARQLGLDLPVRTSLGADDFLVAPPNETAYRLVTGEVAWPDGKLMLVGPAGSGKTHLAALWSRREGAVTYAASAIGPTDELPDRDRIVIEDVQDLPPAAEEWVFHAHNACLSSGGRLLMTANASAARLGIALPDLVTRLVATTQAVIGDPDDALLAAILVKLFADRQLTVAPGVLSYLVTRMERSFGAARQLVEDLDAASLSRKRPITRALARDVLGGTPEGAAP